jgi:hypothetical protein
MDSLDKQYKLRKIDMIFVTWNIRSLYRTGLLMTVAKEIAKYKIWWEYRRSDGVGGTEPAGKCTFFYGKGNENHELGTGFLYIGESYQQLRG